MKEEMKMKGNKPEEPKKKFDEKEYFSDAEILSVS